MGRETGISWTDSTWNPIRGCSRVSEGCRNCYAEKRAHRFSGPGLAYEGLVRLDAAGKSTGKWNGQIKFVEEHLLDPLKWKKPRRIFVNSMSDLFHENVTDELRDLIFGVMAHCPHHTFQVLTKRPERMLEYVTTPERVQRVYDALVDSKFGESNHAEDRLICSGQERILKPHSKYGKVFDCHWPLPNIHLGVSVESAKEKHRIDTLREVPAALRFLSLEPLLGDLGEVNLDGIGWVIVGGESGPGARPMHPDWARSLRDQCKAAGVPFFFKQWGEWRVRKGTDNGSQLRMRMTDAGEDGQVLGSAGGNDVWMQRIGTKAAGCLLDGVEHHEFPVRS